MHTAQHVIYFHLFGDILICFQLFWDCLSVFVFVRAFFLFTIVLGHFICFHRHVNLHVHQDVGHLVNLHVQ